ncbi:hypothetical protein GCM10009796_08530 [Microbacterium koreense]
MDYNTSIGWALARARVAALAQEVELRRRVQERPVPPSPARPAPVRRGARGHLPLRSSRPVMR